MKYFQANWICVPLSAPISTDSQTLLLVRWIIGLEGEDHQLFGKHYRTLAWSFYTAPMHWRHFFVIPSLLSRPCGAQNYCATILVGSSRNPVSLTRCLNSYIEFSKYVCEINGFIYFLWLDARCELLQGRSHLAQPQAETQACMYPQPQALKDKLLTHLPGIEDISWITNEDIWPISGICQEIRKPRV